jgi:hypothetical protein
MGEVQAMTVTLAFAVPGVAAALTGAPWESWLWWQVAGIAAAVVVVTNMETLRVVIRDRDELRQLPADERAAARAVVGVTCTAALAVPVVLVLMWGLAKLDVCMSVASGLAVDYGLWLIAFAMARRATTLADIR